MNPESDCLAMNTSIPSPLHTSLSDNLQPTPADINSRRSISDSVLSRGQVLNYNNKNTVYMMMNRSGGSTVKSIIETIQAKCDEHDQGSSNSSPPEEECCVLAQWAVDAYYRVVIAGKQGIPALVRAMNVFAGYRGLQGCCCLALGNLCMQSGGNLIAVEAAGGVAAIVAAMRNHSSSVAVQSAACDALRNMSNLLLAHAATPSSSIGSELIQVLSHAKEMYLLPSHHSIAENLLSAISAQSAKSR
jgi:hypothetical protein